VLVAGGGPDASYAVQAAPAIRVLVSHPEMLVRASLRALLEQHADISVTGEAADGQQAVELARRERPDVVLIDIRLSRLDPLEATRQILADAPAGATRILVIGPDECQEHVLGVLRAGASGLLAGDTDPAELVRGVRVLVRGEALLSPGATRRLIEEFAAVPDPQRRTPSELEELTAREREVLTLVALGLGNDAIAGRLVVTHATVRTHITRAMRKLHAHDRATLVAIAYESGLVQPLRTRVAAATFPASALPTAAA
jgi:DNA-binding NarL/FixJ family response regulator